MLEFHIFYWIALENMRNIEMHRNRTSLLFLSQRIWIHKIIIVMNAQKDVTLYWEYVLTEITTFEEIFKLCVWTCLLYMQYPTYFSLLIHYLFNI